MDKEHAGHGDARFVIETATENHDLQSGINKMNPILKEIMGGLEKDRARPEHNPFGRLTFSQWVD